jgi:hypothetical protein
VREPVICHGSRESDLAEQASQQHLAPAHHLYFAEGMDALRCEGSEFKGGSKAPAIAVANEAVDEAPAIVHRVAFDDDTCVLSAHDESHVINDVDLQLLDAHRLDDSGNRRDTLEEPLGRGESALGRAVGEPRSQQVTQRRDVASSDGLRDCGSRSGYLLLVTHARGPASPVASGRRLNVPPV